MNIQRRLNDYEKVLLQLTHDVNDGITPYHLIQFFEQRLSPRFFNINCRDEKGFTPLMNIVWNKKSNLPPFRNNDDLTKVLIDILLKHGADIHMTCKYSKNTTLHVAGSTRSSQMIEFLIERGASPHVQNDAGYTPIFYSSYYVNPDTMKALIQCGSDVNFKTDAGLSPMIMVLKDSYYKRVNFNYELKYIINCVKQLLDKGARVNDYSVSGKTPLFHAVHEIMECSDEDLSIIKLLMDAKADMSIPLTKDFVDVGSRACLYVSGDTPLHVAVKKRQPILVKLLLEYHPKIICWNKLKETPLDCAKRLKSDRMTLLIEKEQRHQLYKHLLHNWATPKGRVVQNFTQP
jgi:ankyrin repeat protein